MKPGPQLKGRALQLVMALQEKIVAEERTGDQDGISGNADLLRTAAEQERIKAYQALARYILKLQKQLKEDRSTPRKGQPTLKSVTLRLMRNLDEGARLDIIREFCLWCGSTDTGCHCQNDE